MEKSKIKDIILGEKEKLEKQIRYYESEDPFLVEDRDWTSTLDDDITENEGHDRITAAKNELIGQLKKVDKALKRIEEGQYGVCSKCSSKIPQERLLIMPTAEVCVSCEIGK